MGGGAKLYASKLPNLHLMGILWVHLMSNSSRPLLYD